MLPCNEPLPVECVVEVDIEPFQLSKRSKKGQHQAEFAAAFTVLIVIVVIPLINLAAVPMRMGLAQAIIKDSVKALSLSEKFSESIKLLKGGTMQQRLAALGGVEAKSVELALRISKVGDSAQSITVTESGAIPKSWLPDGSNAPTSVQIVLTVQTDISPLLLANVPGKIPGLTVPFSTTLQETSGWENLGRDANTGEFYVNE